MKKIKCPTVSTAVSVLIVLVFIAIMIKMLFDPGVNETTEISRIPEPQTMVLLGLGALVMTIRRRKS